MREAVGLEEKLFTVYRGWKCQLHYRDKDKWSDIITLSDEIARQILSGNSIDYVRILILQSINPRTYKKQDEFCVIK